MISLKRKIIFYLSILCLLIPSPIYATTKDQTQGPSDINAKGAVLVEQDSMRILWERDAKTPLPMASTTKIMTCILALEKGNMEDIVTASKRASIAPKVKLYLQPGEKQSLEDLLYALMLQSSNDVAVAIAEHIGGSVEVFCQQMTQRAKELGASQTVFKTANGLDAPGHASSPYDLALITKHAYENPDFLKIIQTPSRNIPSKPLEGSRPHNLQNKNSFLTSYQGANGIKTGFTNLAGHCFVGGAKQGDMQLFAVVLASGWGARGRRQKFTDAIKLMEYGFKNYEIVEIKQAMDELGIIPVIKGQEDFVQLAYGQSLSLPLRSDERDQISVSIETPDDIHAPVKEGQLMGKAEFHIGDSLLASLPIIATSTIKERTIKDSLEKVIDRWIHLICQ